VQFKVDGSNFGSAVALASGSAQSQSTSTLTPGDHSVEAVYSPDAGFTGSNVTITQTVNGLIPTTTVVALTSGTNPSNAGDPLTFTATVSAVVGTPTGAVTFNNGSCGGADLAGGPQPLASGQASFSTSSLPGGGTTTTIFACYGGDANDLTSSGSVDQTVN
jgi:hypothetical protein